MSGNDEGLTGRGRVTVFTMFGSVFGYAAHHLDDRRIGDVGVIGPLTPAAGDAELAQWILIQATRAFVCGSDRIAQFQDQGWKLEPGGKRVSFESTYANRDHLWTGNLTVDGLTPDQVAERPSRYRA